MTIMERPINYRHLNRLYCLLYPIALLAPFIGFYLYYNYYWWMFFACLLAYFIQLIPLNYLVFELNSLKKTETIDVSELSEYVKKERNYQIIHSCVFGIAAILDLFPFYAMIESVMGYSAYEGGVIVSIMSIFMAVSLFYGGCINPWTPNNESSLSDIFNIEKEYNLTGLTPLERRKEEYNKMKQAEEVMLKTENEKYGEGHIVLSRDKKIYVNENTNTLFIQGTGYKFNDILSYTVQDNAKTIHSGISSTTETNTGSMLGRAAIGGVLFGNVGAVIGGTTASRTTNYGNMYSTEIHKYKVIITIDSLQSPMVTVDLGNNQELLNKLSSVLTVILNRK